MENNGNNHRHPPIIALLRNHFPGRIRFECLTLHRVSCRPNQQLHVELTINFPASNGQFYLPDSFTRSFDSPPRCSSMLCTGSAS